MSMPPELPFRSGDVFAGKFRIERFIGQGSMAMVVEATHLGLDERVALKFLRRESLAQPDVIARFAREARAAVRIKNDHVARVFDVGVSDDKLPFIVMEFLSGSDLATVLERHTRIETTLAADYIIQACEGIAEAHARGIVHRDVKPENLFLAKGAGAIEQIKVLDFGISKAALGAADLELAAQHTTQIMGSPHYMSPEQLRSTRDVDARADVWSLGVVLYELLAGDTPFVSMDVTSLIAEILRDPHRPLTVLLPDAPPELCAVVDRCLAKDPNARYQSAADLAVALLPFAPKRARSSVERAIDIGRSGGGGRPSVDPDSVPPPPMVARASSPARETTIGASIAVAEPPPRRRGVIVPLLVFLVLLAFGAVVFVALRSTSGPPPVLAGSAAPTLSALPVTTAVPTASAVPSAIPAAAAVVETASASASASVPIAGAPVRPRLYVPVAAPKHSSTAAPSRNPESEIRMER